MIIFSVCDHLFLEEVEAFFSVVAEAVAYANVVEEEALQDVLLVQYILVAARLLELAAEQRLA